MVRCQISIVAMQNEPDTTQEFWDEKYSSRDQVWSGKVNKALQHFSSDLTPGTALDLGCGEGGDAVWLAKNSWRVVACDVSEIALERARSAAIENDVSDKIDFQHHDFAVSFPEGKFDLVSAHFLQSPVELDRKSIFSRASNAVASGGILLVVDHGAAPPWSDHKDHVFLSPQETFEDLGFNESDWKVLHCETFERDAIGPDGQEGHLIDNVLMLQKI